MTKRAFIPVAIAAVVALACVSCNREVEFGKSPVNKVVAAMTLEEKVNLLVGVGAWNGNDIAQEIKDAKSLIPGCAGQTYPIPRLGIPSVMLPEIVKPLIWRRARDPASAPIQASLLLVPERGR